MSEATSQFLEMVKAAVRQNNGQNPDEAPVDVTVSMYCEGCGIHRQHSIHEEGEWERYDCLYCPSGKVFRIL